MCRLRENMDGKLGVGHLVLLVAVLLVASDAVGQVHQYRGKRGYGNALGASEATVTHSTPARWLAVVVTTAQPR